MEVDLTIAALTFLSLLMQTILLVLSDLRGEKEGARPPVLVLEAEVAVLILEAARPHGC